MLVMADLLGSHREDVPTIDPRYWTVPPKSARMLASDPAVGRILGSSPLSSGEPGYASEEVDFFSVRDTLGWSLPIVWGLATIGGETPIVSRRVDAFRNRWQYGPGRLDVAGVTHLVADRKASRDRGKPAGSAVIVRNPAARPRARLVGHPVYVADEAEALAALDRIGTGLGDRLVVEDPSHPLPADADVSGTATIGLDRPERVEVATEATMPAYLVLADTFDPGWSATLDGRPVPIRPAYLAFRAVSVPAGRHAVVFTYRPAGFATGLAITACGAAGRLGPAPLAATGRNLGPRARRQRLASRLAALGASPHRLDRARLDDRRASFGQAHHPATLGE